MPTETIRNELAHPTYDRWQAEADHAQRRAAEHSRESMHRWACEQATEAARCAMRGLLQAFLERGSACDAETFDRALAAAFGVRPADEMTPVLERLIGEAAARTARQESVGIGNSLAALADLETLRAYVDAMWSGFVATLEAERPTMPAR